MKTKILMLVVLMSMSVVMFAQPIDWGGKKSFIERDKVLLMNEGQRGPGNGLNLTDAQKEAFKQSMLATQGENDAGQRSERNETSHENAGITIISEDSEKRKADIRYIWMPAFSV
ncbi:MAG: hypothetical protein Q8P34_00025 [Bacteroidota bacterium]|nr:hypothetical protein [Bacteroidota bacterium]